VSGLENGQGTFFMLKRGTQTLIRIPGLVIACALTAAAALATTVTPTSATVAPATTIASPVVGGGAVTAAERSPAGRRPNIVLITTDDMTVDDLKYMPRTRRLLARQGVSFRDFISPHPLCCPARAEILTGQYAQNNGVRHNEGNWGGFAAHDPDHTIGTWLQAVGYNTAFVGKYINHYYARHGMVPGWDEFNPTLEGTYRPYGFTTFNDGNPLRQENVYIADMVANRTSQYIRDFARQDRPFFVWASQIAPHGMRVNGRWVPPIPANRHARLFSDLTAPSLTDPAYAEADVSDKPRYVRSASGTSRAKATFLFRQRIRSLQSVDEGVQQTVRALREVGELANTVLMFTSDNGYLIGEHRLMGKNYPYEQTLRVPFLVRGPGMPAGATRDQTMTMVDVAPTIVDLADATPDLVMDGRSMVATIRRTGAAGYGTALIQAGDVRRPWFFRGVRTRRYTYVRYHNGFTELYDRRRDPHQMRNVSGSGQYAAVERELARRHRTLVDCSGVTCRRPFGSLPVLRR
jgi:N-acetylglucosamine-6-sulfatase